MIEISISEITTHGNFSLFFYIFYYSYYCYDYYYYFSISVYMANSSFAPFEPPFAL